MSAKVLGVLCFAVLCIILTLGLWPFHPPHNDVTWLKRTSGLAFGRHGTVLSPDALNAPSSPNDPGGSIEIWVQPDRWSGSATVLALYTPEKGLLFALRQSLTDLELDAEVRGDRKARIKAHFYVDEAFGPALRQKKPVVITVAFGRRGTSVYLDGVLAKVAPAFWIPEGAFRGRLVVGDSPRQPDSFRGSIHGLAIYNVELSGAQVLRHYQAWTENHRPDLAQDDHNIALYLFTEQRGQVIRNHAASGGDLYIPNTYTVVDKVFLEPFWEEFNLSRSYWSGNLKNVVGFVPLGFCFYACLVAGSPIRRAGLVTIVIGALTSLTIEILQAFIPTRDSGMTDLITNTLGTYVGVLCYKHIYPAIVRTLPWMSWFVASRSS